jgi:UDP-N-acetylmuramyl pentapeptide synthase
VRLRFALAAALPALFSLAAMALLGDRLARRALEEELGGRLVAVAQAAAAGLPAERAFQTEDLPARAAAVRAAATAPDVLLVKASRGMKLERLLEALRQ